MCVVAFSVVPHANAQSLVRASNKGTMGTLPLAPRIGLTLKAPLPETSGPGAVSPVAAVVAAGAAVAPVVVLNPAIATPPAPQFDVRATDKTVREVLARWSQLAGWVHNADHWTLDRDLPVVGTADANVFGEDFRDAARLLLESTELTDRPAQPCFYSNRVLRVIPTSELCNRAVAAQ